MMLFISIEQNFFVLFFVLFYVYNGISIPTVDLQEVCMDKKSILVFFCLFTLVSGLAIAQESDQVDSRFSPHYFVGF